MKTLKIVLMLSLLATVGCEGDKYHGPSGDFGTTPTTLTGSGSGPRTFGTTGRTTKFDIKTEPDYDASWGPTSNEAAFADQASSYIAALDLPATVPFDGAVDSSKEASLFSGIRCSLMMNKMKSAPVGPRNLFDATELADVCSGDNLHLVPGSAVSSSTSSFSVLTTLNSETTQIHLRPDFTVAGFRVTSSGISSILGGETEHAAAIEKNLKIESTKSSGLEEFSVTDLSGKFTFLRRHTIGTSFRDDVVWKSLEVKGFRGGRTLTVNETQTNPAGPIFGHARANSVGCAVVMENADGTTHAEAHVDHSCFFTP